MDIVYYVPERQMSSRNIFAWKQIVIMTLLWRDGRNIPARRT